MTMYNTTHETGVTLERSTTRNETQEDKILKIFNLVPDRPMGPFMVWKMYNNYHTEIPPTSTRRAITDLTKQGKLIKTDTMEMGRYGKPEHTWKIREKETDISPGDTFICQVCNEEYLHTHSNTHQWCSVTCAMGG